MRNRPLVLVLVLVLVLLALGLPAAPAGAGGAVTVCDEAHLRTALTGGGTVTFSCDGYIMLANTLTISANTTINGSGQSVTISGSDAVRVFNVKSGVTLSLVGLTIREGNDTSSLGGGAVLANGGNVSINNCLFADTNAIFGGCVMVYGGSLTVVDSTFSGCSGSLGGAITGYDAAMTVSHSTFSMNDATASAVADGSGGAIYAEGGTLTVSNSTIHRNSADSNGGGIAGDNATVTVINSTFFNNTAGVGGNSLERSGSGSMTLKNTILYNSLPGANCSGTMTDGGNNLSYSDATCPGVHANPLLQTLNSNGGPTFTMLLGKGSPAIDAGSDAVCAAAPVSGLDQRGVTRPQGAHCDIGAVEQYPYSAVNILKVPDDYAAIQEAVDAADDGDEIWVAAGIYTETLSIPKGLALVGGWNAGFTLRKPGDSTIDGGGAGRVISVTTTLDGAVVTIDGFTIQDGNATGLESAAVPEPPTEPGPEGGGAARAARNAGSRTPSERAAALQARLAELTERGLYRGGPDAAQALLARVARLTEQAEQARTRAGTAQARPSNRPQQAGGSGGGVYSENTALQLLNCTITGNVAAQEGQGAGGGVFVNGAPEDGLRIANNTVGENAAAVSGDGWGGGLYVYSAPGAVIEDNVVEDNVASYDGDGYGGGGYVYDSPDAIIRNNQVRGNLGSQAGEGSEGIGGGLGVDTCPGAAVNDNLLASNTASAAWDAGRGIGGGLFITGCNEADVSDNTVRENLALLNGGVGRGGGIQLAWSSYTEVAGNEVSGNLAALYSGDAQGGGIKVAGVYSTTLTGNEIRNNTAVVYGDVDEGSLGLFGGGVYATEFETSLLGDNAITGNATCVYCPQDGGHGGGAFISSSRAAAAAGNTIADNAAALLDGLGSGGGLHLRDTTGSRVLGNRITGNQAGMANGSHGAGLVLDLLEGVNIGAVVDGNVIVGNRAGGDPGVASSEGGGSVLGIEEGLTFTNNVVAGNHAGVVGGFAIWDLPDGADLVNNTFAGNGDAGLLVSGSVVTLTNNIVVSHTVGVRVDGGASAALGYTLWSGNEANTGGGGAIAETHPVPGDPAFVKPAAGDYRITILSAARDAGDPAGVPPAPDHDADGVARPQGGAVDIGAYEWKGYWHHLPLIAKSAFTLPSTSDMVPVPAGIFQRGCDPAHNGGNECGSEQLPLRSLYLDAYRIDKTEVTNAQYAQCVAAGACTPPYHSSSITRSSYYGNPTYDSFPVIYVSWQQASAYCAWAGKRLPTEAEWERAARGDNDTRAYPWGDAAPTCQMANFWSGSACVGDTSAVGSYATGASPYGALDMAGNVWEWVSDWWQEDYYSSSPESNPQGPATGTFKVLRGGGWANDGFGTIALLVANRMALYPDSPSPNIGIRCAAAPGN